MSRAPKMAHGKISLEYSIHCSPKFLFLLPDQRLHIVKNMCVCVCVCVRACVRVCISDCVRTVDELPLLPNNTAVKLFYTNRSGTNCWLDIHHWGDGLAVTGPIRDTRQKVLQSFFQTGSSNNSSYFQIFFLIACLEEAFIRNTIITLCSN